MSPRHKTSARIAGLLLGCVLSVVFVLSGALPRAEGRFGAAVKLATGRGGDLVVEPSGTIIAANRLQPATRGRAGRGELRLFNPTDVTLSVQPVLAPLSRDLERFVRLRIRAGDRELFDGPLIELRAGKARALRMRSKERRRLSIAARLSESVPPERYEAQTLEGRLDLLTRIEKGR